MNQESLLQKPQPTWSIKVSQLSSRKQRLEAALAAVLAFVVPFALVYFYILNHFYQRGAFFFDSGWLADLMWHKNLALSNPNVLLLNVIKADQHFPPWSYYGTHISPIFSIISSLSYALPFDRVQVFAIYSGAAHGLLGLFMCRIFSRWWFTPSVIWLVFATIFSVAFALNGLAISIATYPHFELLISALLLGCLYFLLEKRIVLAGITAFLAMLVREDAGFHLVAMLSLFVALNCLKGIPLKSQKPLCVFIVLAFLYSCLALVAAKLAFPHFSSFRWVYGNPPFGHVTIELLANRLTEIWHSRVCVWLPLLLLIVGAVVLRAPYVFVGAIVFIPWLSVQLLAVGETAGTLNAHYAYPVILSIGWIGISLAIDVPGSSINKLLRASFAAVVIVATFVATPAVPVFLRDCIPSEFALHPQPTRTFMTLLEQTMPLINRIRADAGIMSLSPESFSPDAWLRPQAWAKEPPSKDTEMLIFFRDGYEHPKAIAQVEAMRDPHVYKVPHTEIMVVTSGPSDPNFPISRVLQQTQMNP